MIEVVKYVKTIVLVYTPGIPLNLMAHCESTYALLHTPLPDCDRTCRCNAIPSRASRKGCRNRSNSISSMADITSPAFSVFRFDFMAKLLALEDHKEAVINTLTDKLKPKLNNTLRVHT